MTMVAVILCAAAGTAQPAFYHVIDLGDLPGGSNYSYASGINDAGQVVGYSRAATGARAFLWDSINGMQNLGDLPGGNDYSVAFGINDAGEVVGYSHAVAGGHAFLWDGTYGMQDLNTLLDASGAGWTLFEATAINDAGWIVGNGLNPNGAGHAYLLVPVPEPASLVLLLCGGLAMLRRWRCVRRG